MVRLLDELAELPMQEQEIIMNQMSDLEIEALVYDWSQIARDNQLLPKEFHPDVITPGQELDTWLILAGRGWGKTRTGAETIKYLVTELGYRRIALVARTAADVRDVMVEGESGLLSVFPSWMKPHYEPSKRRVTFHNGAIATTYSGDQPDQLRGPQHDAAWSDELAAWRYPDAWDQLQFGLRLGRKPINVVTTTPRPTKLIRTLLKDTRVYPTTGNTYENKQNVARSFLSKLLAKYEGTRLGQQELYAQILDDTPGALWKRQQIEDTRVRETPDLIRIVVAIDPAVTATQESNETGIIVAGFAANGHGYVLDDMTLSASPELWAREAVSAYNKWQADRIIGETNNGGDLIETVLRTQDDRISYTQVRASRGKQTRAEPISAFYEQGKVHHVGLFAELEDQMCTWLPGEKSPDRMDALVWALTELMGNGGSTVESESMPEAFMNWRGG